MLPSVLARLATDSAVRVFPSVWKPLFFKTPFLGWKLQFKSLQAINAGAGVQKRESSYTVGGNAN